VKVSLDGKPKAAHNRNVMDATTTDGTTVRADVAQTVERLSRKQRVAGSMPVVGSIFPPLAAASPLP
jgi:hypothetical protein